MKQKKIPKYFIKWFDKVGLSICSDTTDLRSTEYNKAIIIAWAAYNKGREDVRKKIERLNKSRDVSRVEAWEKDRKEKIEKYGTDYFKDEYKN